MRQRIAISFREGHGTWQPTSTNSRATKASLTIPHLASLAIRNDTVFASPSHFNPILATDRSLGLDESLSCSDALQCKAIYDFFQRRNAMLPLDEALAQIADIRGHLARTEMFRGYRSAIVGFSAALAFGAATVQANFIPQPAHQVGQYLALWIAAALGSLGVAAAEITLRCLRARSALSTERARQAAEQFLPCLLAGALLTCALARCSPQNIWMLPGLWSVLFSLGIFASVRVLPREAIWVAAYYLTAGILCLCLGQEERALTPWAMVGTFGIGQSLAAVVLHWTLERRNGI
jgi:hypothetical protein